jgi:hypothetical protein
MIVGKRKMITNDFIQGYIQSLDNIKNALDQYQIADKAANLESEFVAYDILYRYIESTKENYKKLVKDLNEAQSKKTTS